MLWVLPSGPLVAVRVGVFLDRVSMDRPGSAGPRLIPVGLGQGSDQVMHGAPFAGIFDAVVGGHQIGGFT